MGIADFCLTTDMKVHGEVCDDGKQLSFEVLQYNVVRQYLHCHTCKRKFNN